MHEASPETNRMAERDAFCLGSFRRRIEASGLKATSQRLHLGWLLFRHGHRHVTAEQVFAEAAAAKVKVSLATVYNTLHAFAERGIVREVPSVGACSWFDTNTDAHHHYFDLGTGELTDVEGAVDVARLPEPPEGYEIVSCEVVIKLRRRR